jgi:hypothetical protein
MLAALDALIETGVGGRSANILKQVLALSMRPGAQDQDSAALFDDLMATVAMDLDDGTLKVLGPELQQLHSMMPDFIATVMSRYHEMMSRPAGESAAPDPTSSSDPADAGQDDAFETRSPPHTEPEGAVDAPPNRRAQTRDPIADATHPLTLARQASTAQLLEIARLPALPETMTAILLSRAHMPAVAEALANPGANFSRSSLTMLAELAPGDRTLRDALMSRPDLPDLVVDRLLPVIGREARARLIMSGADVTVAQARAALEEAEADQLSGGRRGAPPIAVDLIRAMVADGRMTLDLAVASLARDGRLAELAAFATAEIGCGYVAAYAMLAARLDHPGSILTKAMGAGRAGLDAVLELRRRCRFREGKDMTSGLSAFARYDIDEARLIVKLVERQTTASEDSAETPMQERPRLALVG